MTERHPRLPLEIEPLPEVAWQRVERNLWHALDREAGATTVVTRAPRPRRRWPIALAAGTALAAASALALVWRHGDLDRSPSGRHASRVVTAEAGSSVSVGDVALEVAPRSALVVDDDRADGVLVVLERGTVKAHVAKRHGRPPVVVQAGDVRVEVVGTVFAVSREGDSARVEVYEGVVTVVAGGELSRVAAGQAWPARSASAATDAAAEHAAPVSDESDAPHVGRHEHHGAARHDARVPRASGGTEVAPPSDKERYETAARLEASDPDAARAIYRELGRGSGAWAANALYAQARLELDVGQAARARLLLEAYLRRYPAGDNAADARSLLDRTADQN